MVRIDLQLRIGAPIERCFDLARSIEVHLLGTERTGERAVAGVTTGLMGLGDSVRWRARHFGIGQHLTSRITAFERPTYFQDTMVEGAFRWMRHDHVLEAIGPDMTEMRDVFQFAAPVPVVGWVVERLVLRRYMTNFLRERNLVIKRVAESKEWTKFLPSAQED